MDNIVWEASPSKNILDWLRKPKAKKILEYAENFLHFAKSILEYVLLKLPVKHTMLNQKNFTYFLSNPTPYYFLHMLVLSELFFCPRISSFFSILMISLMKMYARLEFSRKTFIEIYGKGRSKMTRGLNLLTNDELKF